MVDYKTVEGDYALWLTPDHKPDLSIVTETIRSPHDAVAFTVSVADEFAHPEASLNCTVSALRSQTDGRFGFEVSVPTAADENTEFSYQVRYSESEPRISRFAFKLPERIEKVGLSIFFPKECQQSHVFGMSWKSLRPHVKQAGPTILLPFTDEDTHMAAYYTLEHPVGLFAGFTW